MGALISEFYAAMATRPICVRPNKRVNHLKDGKCTFCVQRQPKSFVLGSEHDNMMLNKTIKMLLLLSLLPDALCHFL
jgi:hypothetical protein